jgi:hypothetical protein
VAEYDTAIESPFTTALELEKSPAENRVPVVLSIVALPPMLMKQPATVPVDVIENVEAEEVALTPAAAALNEGVLRLPEYVGALAKPTSNQPA